MSITLWNRAGVGIAFIFIAVLAAVLLVQSGRVAAQKGAKVYPIELSASFRGASDDGVYSDNPSVPYVSNGDTPGYPNNVLLREPGTLYMRIQKNRRVYFNFNVPSISPPITSTYVPNNTDVTCHEYAVDGVSGKIFTEPAPVFLTNGTVTLDNDLTIITTSASVRYDAASGWVEDATLPTMAKMAVTGTPLYVWLSFRFDTIVDDESFHIHHNYELWTGLSPRTGIAKVTHPDVNTWVLVPLPDDDPDHPLRALGRNDASLTMAVGTHRKDGHSGGYCDLGYWNMPFELTLTRR